jgi:hypothetical protein
MIKWTSRIRIVFEFLEVNFVMINCGILVVHLDGFPSKFNLGVTDREGVKVGHGRRELLNTWMVQKMRFQLCQFSIISDEFHGKSKLLSF